MEERATTRRITRNRAGSGEHHGRRRASTPVVEPVKTPLRRKLKGQSIIIIALSAILLIGMVGLAIDGGSMLGQRREAQNAVDGSALAGTRTMLTYYSQMVTDHPEGDVDYAHSFELNIRSAIEQYAAANGVLTTTLKAYFVNDDRQIVSVQVGIDKGQGHCGVVQPGGPCEVGDNGLVPFTLGVKGIDVTGTAQTNTFFMNIFGWNKASAAATATGYMGVGAMADNVSLIPLGLYGTSGGGGGGIDLDDIHVGEHYTLIDATLDTGSGNWGWVNYNGSGTSATTVRAWLSCGFNPSIGQTQWENVWCPGYKNAPGWGPTKHYVPYSAENWDPDPDHPVYPFYIKYGDNENGWWLSGSSGSVNANCKDFKDRADASGSTGVEVLFPFFDRIIPAGGTDSFYHVRIIFAFNVKKGYVSCKPTSPPTATACPVGYTCPTPTPSGGGGGGNVKWHIEGDATRIYSTTSSGRHGDIRRTSIPVIFLDK